MIPCQVTDDTTGHGRLVRVALDSIERAGQLTMPIGTFTSVGLSGDLAFFATRSKVEPDGPRIAKIDLTDSRLLKVFDLRISYYAKVGSVFVTHASTWIRLCITGDHRVVKQIGSMYRDVQNGPSSWHGYGKNWPTLGASIVTERYVYIGTEEGDPRGPLIQRTDHEARGMAWLQLPNAPPTVGLGSPLSYARQVFWLASYSGYPEFQQIYVMDEGLFRIVASVDPRDWGYGDLGKGASWGRHAFYTARGVFTRGVLKVDLINLKVVDFIPLEPDDGEIQQIAVRGRGIYLLTSGSGALRLVKILDTAKVPVTFALWSVMAGLVVMVCVVWVSARIRHRSRTGQLKGGTACAGPRTW
jgi:hypothetical protein